MIDIENCEACLCKQPDPIAKFREDTKRPEVVGNIPGTQTIFVKSMGCSHNMSDGEAMMGQLKEYGYKLTDSEEADLWLINSCTVKNPSQDTVMTYVKKAQSRGIPIVVSGCVPQADRDLNWLDGISVLGVTQIDRIVEVVEQTLAGGSVRLLGKKELPSLSLPKIRRNPLVEIIPISTGCLGSCTYCKTKHARGHLGSYPPEVILNRVKEALSEGVKDIWLTSEDSGAYGKDIGADFPGLLESIANILPDDCMLRVGMTNPPFILEKLEAIGQVLKHPRVYSFLHIPVQAGNNDVLHHMNREYTVEEFSKVVDTIRSIVPDTYLATDIICGFPTETSEQFEDTLKLVEKYRFPSVYISQFYPRPGTAAASMKLVPTKEVKRRSTEMTKLFHSYKCFDHLLGKVVRVYLRDFKEGKDRNEMVGHTKEYVKVILPREESLIGKSLMAKITETDKWHVRGVKYTPKNSWIWPLAVLFLAVIIVYLNFK